MRSNPFATRFVAPGRIRWIGSQEDSTERIAARFTGPLKSRGAILGGHGTGKSTLVEHLLPHLGTVAYRQLSCGRTVTSSNAGQVILIGLRRTSQPYLQIRQSREYWLPGRLLILDGFEQISLAWRTWLILHTRWRNLGLLVTSHRRVGLPILHDANVNVAKARSIVAAIFETSGDGLDTRWASRFAETYRLQTLLEKHEGNMREVLMEMYDLAQAAVHEDAPRQAPKRIGV